MPIKNSNLILLVIAFSLFEISCSKGDVAPPAAPPATDICATINAKFGADVSVIVQTNCATNSSCHAAGSINGPGPLLTFAQINAAAAAMKTQVENKTMPKGAVLSQSDINKIKCWVNAGALNN